MSRKWFFVLNVLGGLLLAAGFTLWISSPAHAQCGDPPPKSSCITCHTQENPVYEKGEWHRIHALKDCCASCHGGNNSTMDKDLAHESLVAQPLDDIYTDCRACHPDDYPARAERFASALGVTPGSSPTATPVPIGSIVEHPIVILPPSIPHVSSVLPWPLVLGGLVFTALLLLLGFRIMSHENRCNN